MKKSSPSAKDELVINEVPLRKARLKLRALNHKLRQQILHFIHQQKETMVTNIYESLNLEQSVASQHLAILRRAGFVATRRDGKRIYYSVNYGHLYEFQETISEFLNQ